MAITSSHKSQFRQCELPTRNTYHMFLENKPFSGSLAKSLWHRIKVVGTRRVP